jgi:hypothetical protein
MARLKEPSTYAGLAALTIGLGQIFDINEAPAVAETITSITPSIIAGDWIGALMVAFGGLAVYLKERKD